jgi:hypothetical protein
MTLYDTIYHILSYCFDTEGILYEKKQNEMLYEILHDYKEKE